MTCSSIVVDVRPSSNFTGLGSSDINTSFMPNGAQYNCGAALPDHDRASRLPDAVVPASHHLGGTPYTFVQNVTGLTTYNGKLVKMLSAASVFRNEPFVAADGSDGSCS